MALGVAPPISSGSSFSSFSGSMWLPPGARRAVELAYQIAGENLVETRHSMAMLKSRQPNLATLLSAASDGVRRLGQGKVVAALKPVPSPPNEVAHELLRIAQEAMLNAARHAEARTIQVALAPTPEGGVRIAVEDDGKGFDPTAAAHGFGLVGLRERAAAIEAKLSIVSKPGAGTKGAVTWVPPRGARARGLLQDGARGRN